MPGLRCIFWVVTQVEIHQPGNGFRDTLSSSVAGYANDLDRRRRCGLKGFVEVINAILPEMVIQCPRGTLHLQHDRIPVTSGNRKSPDTNPAPV